MLKQRDLLDDLVTLAASRDSAPPTVAIARSAVDADGPARAADEPTKAVTAAASVQRYEAARGGSNFATFAAAPGASKAGAEATHISARLDTPAARVTDAVAKSGIAARENDSLEASSWRLATEGPAGTPTKVDSAPVKPAFSAAALATTQPQQIDFSANGMPVFGADTSLSFALPTQLWQHYGFSTGVSFAGFGLNVHASVTGGIKGSVALSLGQYAPDYPITINPGVAPFVLDGQVFSICPTLVSTDDASFALSLPEANASLDFGLQASAGVTFSFPTIPIGFSLPFIGFVGYHLHIPSESIGFNSGGIFKLGSSTTVKIPGNGSVTVSELQTSVINSGTVSGFDNLPTLTASGSTAPFIAANVDLVALLAQEVPDPFAVLAGSKSFGDGAASLSYELFGLPLSASLWLSEAVTVTPVGINETVTDTLTGKSQSGPLGTSFNFTAPASGAGIIPFSITYGLVLSVETTLELDGNVTLALTGPSVSASVLGISASVGPLGNFNLFSISGKLAELYSNTSTETVTSTGTVDVQNLASSVVQTVTTSSGPVNITQPATDLTITAAGTVTGGAYGINTGTLSSAMVTDYGLITASTYGVELDLGGTVNVEEGGRITTGTSVNSGSVGVLATKNPVDAVTNSGAITGFATGISLVGGSVTNWTGAVISASSVGIEFADANASIVNNGSIVALHNYRDTVTGTPVSFTKGGSLYNGVAGVITGGAYGVNAGGGLIVTNHCTLTAEKTAIHGTAGGTVTNLAGAYIHGGSSGVTLGGSGADSVTNDLGGTISGDIGVALTGAYTTLVDYGLISGSNAAVELYGTVSNTLVLGTEAQLSGAIRLGSASNAISLMGGSGVGTLAGLGGALAFHGTITIASGAGWDIDGKFSGVTLYGLNAHDQLDDTAVSYSAGDWAVLDRQTDVLSLFAVGSPTTTIGTIQLYGPLGYAPIVKSDGSGGVEIDFDAQKLTTVSGNSGEVYLAPAGSFFSASVTISKGVTISSNYYGSYAQAYGVFATKERATLTNYGTILGNHTAVNFVSGGVVTNEAGGVISANVGVLLGSNSSDTMDRVSFTNAGSVTSQQTGVYLDSVGTVTNMAGGQITSNLDGVQLQAGGEVDNLGTISGGRTGVNLVDGGFAYNQATGLITGKDIGVDVDTGYGKVINCGTIDCTASGAGVNLGDGGLVVSETGLIEGATIGVRVAGAAGNITNGAVIAGIQLTDGGWIANAAGGTVTAMGDYAISFYNANGPVAAYLHNTGRVDGVQAFCGDTIVNAGTIDGVGLVGDVAGPGSITVSNTGTISGGALGAVLRGGSYLTNGDSTDTTALIEGVGGVYAGTGGDATVTNFATIDGTGGKAVQFAAASDRLIVEAGAVFVGSVKGGGGVLEMADGAGTITGLGVAGTLSGALAMSFSGFGGYVIDSGGDWTLSGAEKLAANQSLTVAGTVTNAGSLNGAGAAGVTLTGGGSALNGAAADATALIAGVIGVYAGASTSATVTNYGTIDGTGGVAVEFKSAGDQLIAESGSTLTGEAQGGGGTLDLASGTGTIHGLGTTGTIAGSDALIFTGFGTYLLGGGSSWTLAGPAALAAGQTLTIANAATLQVEGAVSNAGVIDLASTGAQTNLCVMAAGATLTGGGTVTLNGATSKIYGALNVATLTNLGDTITGRGYIGAGSMTLVNKSGGVIDASSAGELLVDTQGETLTNAGLMESTLAGAALLFNTTTIANAGGAIAGAGGLVDLQNAEVIGGTLAGTRPINVNTGSSTLDGADAGSITLTGAVQVLAGTTLTAQGTLNGTGSVTLFGGGKLIVGTAGLTLNGGVQLDTNPAAGNTVVGALSGATLTNLNGKINAVGQLGDGSMVLINGAAGVIVGALSTALTINTGASTISNSGVIESDGKGGVVIASAVANTGTLLAAAGTLSLDGLITGAGIGKINGGVLYAATAAGFDENVTFGATGTLKLGDSAAYAGTISGFSKTGTTSLDLADIAYKSGSAKASYSGTAAGGILTVTSGSEVAHIHFTGNYLAATWIVGGDGNGGTRIVDPTAGAAAASTTEPMLPPFVQTLASLAATHAATSVSADIWRTPPPTLTAPRAQLT